MQKIALLPLISISLFLSACNLTITNSGGGVVTSESNLIDCGTICEIEVQSGTQTEILLAEPDEGFRFVGWTGANCEDVDVCEVTIGAFTGNKTITARFERTSECPQDSCARFSFPPGYSLTEGETVTVRGTTTPSSSSSTITSVSIAGVLAQSSDGFLTWQAELSLSLGSNSFQIEVFDSELGERTSSDGIVVERVENPITNIEAAVFDNEDNRIIYIDNRKIMAIDLSSGRRSIITQNGVSVSQPPLFDPFNLVLDKPRNRLLVLDLGRHSSYGHKNDRIIAIDLDTGERSLFTEFIDGTGITDFDIDLQNDRLFVSDQLLEAIFTLDLITTARTLVSDNSTPNDLNPTETIWDIAVDAVNDRIFAVDVTTRQILSVNMQNGRRTVLDIDGSPAGFFKQVSVDAQNNRLLAHNGGTLYTLSLLDGSMTPYAAQIDGVSTYFNRVNDVQINIETSTALVSTSDKHMYSIDLNNNRGELIIRGEDLDIFSSTMTFIPETKQLAQLDSLQDVIYITDPETGQSHPIGDPASLNNSFSYPTDIAYDPINNQFLAVDFNSYLYAIDGVTGVGRKLASGRGAESSVAFVQPHAVTVDSDNNRALILDCCSRLVSADLSFGTLESIAFSSSGVTNGNGMVLDKENNRMLFVESGYPGLVPPSLREIDLETGGISLISNVDFPDSTNAFKEPEDLALYQNNALVIDRETQSLYKVDLTQGTRTILSNGDSPNSYNIFMNPTQMEVDPDLDRAYVIDSANGKIVAVDLITGERVHISPER